jgi:hypothetical protein
MVVDARCLTVPGSLAPVVVVVTATAFPVVSPGDLTMWTSAGHALEYARALQSYAAVAFVLVRAAVTCALDACA